ncbi:MAG: dihydrodipicolinate synthase family protein, partial [Planctomyces sp.]
MKSVFSGIIPPVVTPLLSAEELDAAAVDRVVDHMIDGGVSGLFLLGTTGEGPSLMYQVRYEMVEQACRKADGRVPSLVEFAAVVKLEPCGRSGGARGGGCVLCVC